MGYESVIVDRFGGLQLPEDPEELGFSQALDMANVDVDRRGRLRTRDGFTYTTAAEAASQYATLVLPTVSGNSQLLAARTGAVDAINTITGAIIATSGAGSMTSSASIDSLAFVADGSTQLRTFDGLAFASPAGLAAVTAKYLAVQSPDNRLVAAGGGIGDSRVAFSADDDPTSFNLADPGGDWVDISPGDGEQITGMVAWEDMLFVFKQTKFAIFYGNSVDSVGGAVFNYRMVNTGAGASTANLCPVTAGPDGVYFANTTGVFRTAGGVPDMISGPIEPVFRDAAAPSEFTGGDLLQPQAMAFSRRRLYVTATPFLSPSNELYVLDIDQGTWLRWDLNVAGIVSGLTVNGTEEVWVSLNDINHVAKLGGTTDNGTAISWSYGSGYADFGTPEVKVLREAAVWGSGVVQLQIMTDHGRTSTADAVTLESTTSEKLIRSATRGRFFRYGLAGSGPATVNRVVFYARGRKGAGAR